MPRLGRADKIVIRDVQLYPQLFDARHNVVDELLGIFTGFLRFPFDLLPMLIRSRQIHHVIAAQPFVTGHRVARHGGISMADVKLVAWIIDRGCNVKRFFYFPASSKPPEFF